MTWPVTSWQEGNPALLFFSVNKNEIDLQFFFQNPILFSASCYVHLSLVDAVGVLHLKKWMEDWGVGGGGGGEVGGSTECICVGCIHSRIGKKDGHSRLRSCG